MTWPAIVALRAVHGFEVEVLIFGLVLGIVLSVVAVGLGLVLGKLTVPK